MQQQQFTFTTRLPRKPIADYRPAVEAALKSEGFGIPVEIDMQALWRDKLGIEAPAFLILGACNPALSNRMLAVAPEAGALLPCNVVLREDGDGVVVEAIDPRQMLALVADQPAVAEVAEDVRARLVRAVEAIEREFATAG